ncbi:hypothetical protein [Brevibacillus marinus]|uniref:hypothetical protein n=1 Tax=Brevibacillus marinus TaxID=2496837 RepID=UPI000F82D73D|nr:hypothetical protein [Brevibacillus marinus]
MSLAEVMKKMNLTHDQIAALEPVLISGDLSKVSDQVRSLYYQAVCESVGLNPLTKPFEYIELNGKLTLYAKRDCTEQLRKIHGISIVIASRELIGDIFVVTARGTTKDGRTDESIGAVPIIKEERKWVDGQNGRKGFYQGTGKYVRLQGDELANAMMKAETKSKRRVTLSLAGLGWLDETEVETIDSSVALGGNPPSGQQLPPIDAQNQEPAQPYDVVTGKVTGLVGADFKVNEKDAFFITLEGGKQVLIPVDHPVVEYFSQMEGHNFHFKVINWEGKHAIAGGMEAIKAVEDQTEKPYLLKRMETGNREDGTPYAKILLVHQPTGNLVDAYALGTEQVNEVKKIREGIPFQATFMVQNGFRFVTSVMC